jgi:hypothetical protein
MPRKDASMSDGHVPEDLIPPEEIQEVLAELGLELTLTQATEVARLLDTTGDLEEAIAALDHLLEQVDEEDGDGWLEAA